MTTFFDIRTLSVTMGVVIFALGLCMVYHVVARKTYKGFGAWTMGTIMVGLGFCLVGLRHVLPNIFSIVVANALIYSALALYYLGFKSFSEKEGKPLFHVAIVLTLSLGVVSFFTYVNPSVNARISIISVVAALYFFFNTLILARDIQYSLGKLNRLLAATLILISLLFAFRGIFFLLPANAVNSYMSTGGSHAIALLAIIVLAIFFVIGLIQLNSQMLEKELYRDQEQLRKSEAQKKAILEGITTNLAFVDAELKILWANKTAADSVNRTVDDMIGLKCHELWADSDSPCDDCPTAKAFKTKKTEQTIIHTPDGRVWEEKGEPVFDEKGRLIGVLEIAHDITARAKAEEALRESEKKYRTLVEESFDGIFIQKGPSIIFVNKRLNEMLGYGDDELIGQDHWVVYHPDYQKLTRERAQARMHGDKVAPRYEVKLQRKDGSWFYGEINARPITFSSDQEGGIQVWVKDIDERKRAEDSLRESEEKYRLVIENATDAIFIAQNEILKFANPKAEKMTGYSALELAKIPFASIIHHEDRYMVLERHQKRLKGEEIPNIYSFRIFNKSGEELSVELNTVLISWEGKPATLNFLRDITKQKRLEAQLQQAQKMEAIGTLAGGIAHDFNNILSVILGNAELASFDIPESNRESESLKAIHGASIRAKDLVQQLLAFSRKNDDKSMPFNMSPIIKESMKMLRSVVPTSVEFKQHISGDVCTVLGDATQINQIVINLATNAAHAMSEEGGLLEVTLENIILQEEKACFDWVLAPGPYIRLTMRDTGKGIEPTIIDRIFEPYFTTKEVGKGTGMGLSVVHGIVKRHGGGLSVESAIGKGTVFEIYFPALEKTAEEKKNPEGEIKGGSERILFVDDEESLVNLNRQRLARLGYDVKSTTQPVEALEWLKADPDKFDVIITDMTMPQMTGDRLAAEVLKIRPNMPVIICTGYSVRMSAEKAEALGVSKYIEKPIDLRNLAASLREVLDGK